MTAIFTIEDFQNNLVLKGGTALKKNYFHEYRFSEDLDFSTRQLGKIENINTLIGLSVTKMQELLLERGPFRVEFEPYLLRLPHPNDQIAYIIRVQFPYHREPLCRLKVEISVDEPILTTPNMRPLLHGFPEPIYAEIPVYSLLEITAEKLRALLQSKEKLNKRGWGATRVCRDYYDLYHLLEKNQINKPELIPLLKKKCELRNINYQTPHDFLSQELLNAARTEWLQQVAPFIPSAPSADEILQKVEQRILSILT